MAAFIRSKLKHPDHLRASKIKVLEQDPQTPLLQNSMIDLSTSVKPSEPDVFYTPCSVESNLIDPGLVSRSFVFVSSFL
jgi:hypothetical protein